MGDIPSRRGMIQGQEQRGNAIVIQAKVPLGQMFGYATDLRSGTQGRAVYTCLLYTSSCDNCHERGQELTRNWCSNCHTYSAEGSTYYEEPLFLAPVE